MGVDVRKNVTGTECDDGRDAERRIYRSIPVGTKRDILTRKTKMLGK